MILHSLWDPNLIAEEFERLANANTNSWEDENVTITRLSGWFNRYLFLITNQTEDPNIAPKLQSSLQALQARISQEKSPEANALAFEIMGIANGLFNKDKVNVIDWENLPPSLWNEILSKNLPKAYITNNYMPITDSGLVRLACTSKKLKPLALAAKKNWVNSTAISLRTFGCKTAMEAVQYIIDNNINSANLQYYSDVTDDDLRNLAEKGPKNLQQLLIHSSKKITELPISNVTTLTNFVLFHKNQIQQNRLTEILVKNPQLKSLDIVYYTTGFRMVTSRLEPTPKDVDDKFFEALGTLTGLTSLNLSRGTMIQGDKLAKALSKLTNLRSLNLSSCAHIQEEDLAEALSNLTNLRDLNLSGCFELDLYLSDARMKKTNKLIEAFSKLTLLERLDLSNCRGLEGRLVKILSSLPNLTYVNIEYFKFDLSELMNIQRKFPKVEIRCCVNN